MNSNSLYHTDFAAWAFQQAALLKGRKFDQVDLDELIEEIESMGKSEYRELRSRLIVLIQHLLKWQAQPERQSKSWHLTIKVQRRDIKRHLAENPSLKSCLNDNQWLDEVWENGVLNAANETLIDLDAFPQHAIWTVEQILDDDFYPTLKDE